MINSFKYPDIKKEDRKYAGIAGDVVRENGDWRDVFIPDESQGQNGIEPSSCYVEAPQKTIATLKELKYDIQDENYSARFNALLSKGTPTGGDPLKGAYSIKKDGLIPQFMMDWNDVNSWDDYHSWKGVNKDKNIAKGQEEANQWDKKYYILSEKDNPIEIKYNNLRQGLKRSPVDLSVYAWLERDGKYYKPEGVSDTHLVKAEYVNKNNETTIKDTYPPYIKVLEANTDFDFSMYWIIRKLSPEEMLNNAQKSLIMMLYEFLAILLRKVYRVGGEVIGAVFNKYQK